MTGKSAREALPVSDNRLMVNSEFFRIEVLNVRVNVHTTDYPDGAVRGQLGG